MHSLLQLAAATAIQTSLTEWLPADPAQTLLRTEYASFVRAGGGGALDRDGGAEHLTASCFVFTPDLRQVLLCFHRKGQFWVQLGGHIESADLSVAAAALREAREEGGIAELRSLGDAPIDVHRHALSSRFGHCTTHWDVGFAAIAPAEAIPVTSSESEEVAWWPTDALPDNVPSGFGDRLAVVLRELEHRRNV
ncbi:NUDIX domain-containing protein [Cryobacterium mannosilyticum]|uniref:NUDIX domain-containing protein n=1 Tax=Cryobacterium mannosilyticum TaxID=1259190 RepID=A0A4R8WC47_9MICO|nr:NUDIX domain-containing protein [Cryobacterium mannosilyticum]TFC05011.1 NUDIX domain-containing protein [Cryobacterium mannosilyticum]